MIGLSDESSMKVSCVKNKFCSRIRYISKEALERCALIRSSDMTKVGIVAESTKLTLNDSNQVHSSFKSSL